MKFLLRKGHQPDIPCGCPWISMVTLFRISERGQNQITFFLTYCQEMEEIRTLLFVLYSCIHLFIWERQNQTAQKHVAINCILFVTWPEISCPSLDLVVVHVLFGKCMRFPDTDTYAYKWVTEFKEMVNIIW